MDTNLTELMHQLLAEKQAVAAAGTSQNSVIIWGMIISALGSVIAAAASWIGKRESTESKKNSEEAKEITITNAGIVKQVESNTNSTAAAMVAKMDGMQKQLDRNAEDSAKVNAENARLTEQLRGHSETKTAPAVMSQQQLIEALRAMLAGPTKPDGA